MLASSRKFARAFCGKRNMIASFSSDVAEMKYTPLLQAGEAIALLQQPRIRFVDASFHMDKTRDPTSEYLNERIPGAVRFDIDSVCDKTSPLPHMLPSAEDFSSAMNGLKIENDTHVVLYGAKNALAIPRAWWTFKVFGHNNVSIIDGGLEEWKLAGGPVESGPVDLAVESSSGNYRATKNCEYVSSSKDVVAAMTSGRAQIADARSLGRFRGELPEPREGLRGGAIPGSLCIPFTAIVDPDNYTKFKSLHEMNRVFKDNGLVYGTKVILTCGSGVTASILHFGLHLMGMELQSIPVYDGSWTEWGDPARTDLPVMGPQ